MCFIHKLNPEYALDCLLQQNTILYTLQYLKKDKPL